MFSATSQPETFPGMWDNISPYEPAEQKYLASRKVLSLTGITFAHMNRPLLALYSRVYTTSLSLAYIRPSFRLDFCSVNAFQPGPG